MKKALGTFETVRAAAETALRSALRVRKVKEFGAVNWGDLGIVGISKIETESGARYFRVEIEEASEGCDLENFIYEHIKKRHGWEVEICCSW